MDKMILLPAFALAAMTPALASDQTEVMVTMHQFIDGFNQDDLESAAAACADPMSFIDDFSPHLWQGAGAFSKWVDAFEADARQNAITDGCLTLKKTRHIDATSDRADVVASANDEFKQMGKATTEAGSTITSVLQKGPAGWRISAWAWAKN